MNTAKREHLISLVQGFDTAMLFTKTLHGGLRGRPMGLADVQEDGTLYFCASVNSEKVAELTANPEVAVGLQGKTQFASLSGIATVNRDRPTIERLWKESWKLWFPKGTSDPDLCLINFDPSEGEYWDNSGVEGVKFAINAALAYFSGERVQTSSDNQNSKVNL